MLSLDKNVDLFLTQDRGRLEEIIKKNKLLDGCLNGNGDVFKEIKKIRQHKPTVATSMDKVNENIPNHFKEIYENLYNSVDDRKEMIELNNHVEANINHAQLYKGKQNDS